MPLNWGGGSYTLIVQWFERKYKEEGEKRKMYPKMKVEKKSNPHRKENIFMQSAVYYDAGYRRLGLTEIVVCSGFFLCLTFNNLLYIIIMLILAGVAINIAINTGLFNRAGEAADKTRIAIDYEANILPEEINNIINKYTGGARKPATLPPILNGANSPDISGFNVDTTTYVTWNTGTSPYVINDTIKINEQPPSGWSNYTSRNK